MPASFEVGLHCMLRPIFPKYMYELVRVLMVISLTRIKGLRSLELMHSIRKSSVHTIGYFCTLNLFTCRYMC